MTEAVRKQLEAAGVPVKRTSAPRSPKSPPAPVASPTGQEKQEVVFSTVVPGNNGTRGLLRIHWTQRQRLALSYEYIVHAARLAPMPGPVRLELVRYSTGPPMDYDNLVSTGKLLVDALVRCGVLPDDKPAVIAERHYSQQRAEGKDTQRTVIRLTQLEFVTTEMGGKPC